MIPSVFVIRESLLGIGHTKTVFCFTKFATALRIPKLLPQKVEQELLTLLG